MSDDLVAFLRARLDEDERVARSTKQNGLSWQNFEMDGELRDDRNAGTVASVIPETREHIARHDPARVLREVEAKRRILDVHAPEPLSEYVRKSYCEVCQCYADGIVEGAYPCATVALLASMYSDHPDYRPEWRT